MENRLKEVIRELNLLESERLKKEGYTNNCFFIDLSKNILTDVYKIKLLEKKKYYYINFGSSGAFMVNKENGLIYNIKGYGTADLKKCLGDINTIDINFLHSKRWNYLRG